MSFRSSSRDSRDQDKLAPKKKRRFTSRRKRVLDPNTIIDYKKPDILKRFITDRGKIIPRRISGANAKQQRMICEAVKRARFLGLIMFSNAHRVERGFPGEMALATAMSSYGDRGPRRDRPEQPREREQQESNDESGEG